MKYAIIIQQEHGTSERILCNNDFCTH